MVLSHMHIKHTVANHAVTALTSENGKVLFCRNCFLSERHMHSMCAQGIAAQHISVHESKDIIQRIYHLFFKAYYYKVKFVHLEVRAT